MPTEDLEFCFGWWKGFIVKSNRKKNGKKGSVYCLVLKWILCLWKVFLFFPEEAFHAQFLLKEDNSRNSINNKIRGR